MDHNKGFLGKFKSRFERNRLGELLVQRGKLTPHQLRVALKHQQKSGKTFGQTVRDLNFVSQTDIRTSLFEQVAYRAVVTSLTIFISFTSFTVNAQAKDPAYNVKSQFSQQSMIHKASYGGRDASKLGETQQKHQPLFGTKEIASSDISAFKKWTTVLSRLENITFKDSKLNQFRGMGLSSKVVAVNEYVNNFRYIEDKDNFGKSDYWATPTEFFARGGDCEDFAIAKYAILKQLGVPEDKMRLAIVQDKIKNIPHAVLIVYTDNGPMLLDNQMKATKQVASVDRYKPIYSINSTGWWRHLS